jgi:hypothetical protein
MKRMTISSLLIVFLWLLLAPATHADMAVLDPTKFGHVSQNATALMGVCAAANGLNYACGPVAAVNSFVFLQNTYPDIYDNSLTNGNNVGTVMSLAMPNFMNCVACNGGTTIANFISGKKKWIEQQVPGKTAYSDMQNPTPAYILGQLKAFNGKGEDVELLIGFYDKTTGMRVGGHYVTDYGIATGNSMDLWFVDPNGGMGTNTAVNMELGYMVAGGVIQINNYGANTVNARVDWAVAESPIPEPGSLSLVGLGCSWLLIWRRRNA